MYYTGSPETKFGQETWFLNSGIEMRHPRNGTGCWSRDDFISRPAMLYLQKIEWVGDKRLNGWGILSK
ncbi:MAG: hypothetical protein EBE86_019725 [Hormoscilla sp. GUM202]|nr:hypothetical protein [Hormoscilla sp. GUM202]